MGLSPIGTSASIAAQAPSLPRNYPASSVLPAAPPSQSARPFCHELPVDPETTITAGTSRVAYGPLCLHAIAHTPAGRMEFVRSYDSIRFGLPRNRGGSAPALRFSRPAQRSLTLRPACSPSRLATLCTEGFSSFVPPPLLRLLPSGANQFPGGFHSRCGPSPFTAHPGNATNREQSDLLIFTRFAGWRFLASRSSSALGVENDY
jgi:hypothetical protein